MSLVATAPGKVMLSGEYAVIDGGPAVVVAVNRRVQAHVAEAPVELSLFLDAVRRAAPRFGGDPSRAERVAVDSDVLRAPCGTKLGLGSSAAVTVAAAALSLGRDAPPSAIHGLAHYAHRSAQGTLGAKGSGADIAAIVHGGVVAARIGPGGADAPLETTPLTLPSSLHLAFVWTGLAADTASLVALVQQMRANAPVTYQQRMDGLAAAATALTDAFMADDASAALLALSAGAEAVAALGEAAGADLDTAVHRRLRGRARGLGGILKPTGAGAGDMAVAAFLTAADATRFTEETVSEGILCPSLRVEQRGVHLE